MTDPVASARRPLLVFTGALAGEIVLSIAIRATAVAPSSQGNHAWRSLLATVGLAWLLVLALSFLWAARSMLGISATVRTLGDDFGRAASSSPDWFWQSDGDLVLTYSSAGVRVLLGYDPSEVVGRKITDLVDGVDRMRVEAATRLAVARSRSWGPDEVLWRHRNGSLIALVEDGSPILTNGGRLVGFHGVRRAVARSAREQPRLDHIRQQTEAVIASSLIVPALQPIVELNDGTCVGAEALSRFPGGDRPPNAWFADAHEVHLGVELELAALDAALRTAAQLPANAYLSCNASPSVILDGRLGERLEASGVPLDRIVLEITEHTSIEHYAAVTEQLAPLRGQGLRIAVDDTGAGFASFRHVLQLKPDVIKLDRSLIEGIAEDNARRALITSIVLLAFELRAQVTAEGVETPDELEVLRSLGADCAQGYLLGRPTTDRMEWQRWCERTWLSAIY